jgi:hypothetical protein
MLQSGPVTDQDWRHIYRPGLYGPVCLPGRGLDVGPLAAEGHVCLPAHLLGLGGTLLKAAEGLAPEKRKRWPFLMGSALGVACPQSRHLPFFSHPPPPAPPLGPTNSEAMPWWRTWCPRRLTAPGGTPRRPPRHRHWHRRGVTAEREHGGVVGTCGVLAPVKVVRQSLQPRWPDNCATAVLLLCSCSCSDRCAKPEPATAVAR